MSNDDQNEDLSAKDLSAEDQMLLRNWQAGPGAQPTPEDSSRWHAATRDGLFPVRRAHDTADVVIGNDGLTDAERAEYARRYAEGAGKTPTKAQMAYYRSITPITRRTTGDQA